MEGTQFQTQDDMQPVAETKQSKSMLPVILTFVVLLLILGGGAWYFFLGGKAVMSEPVETSPAAEELAAQEALINEIVTKAGAVATLPAGETPLVAEVKEADTLIAEQPFYENVQNGDWIIVYGQAQQAFIYRESTNEIVNSGNVAIDPNLLQ